MNTIKKQIMAGYIELLSPLLATLKLRKISRAVNPLQSSDILPSLLIYDGAEEEIGKDSRGIVLRFPIAFKMMFESNGGLSDAKDDLAGEIIKIVEGEANNQLGGLINGLSDFAEQPFINELQTVGGTILLYTCEYRRKRGAPDETY